MVDRLYLNFYKTLFPIVDVKFKSVINIKIKMIRLIASEEN